MLGTGSTAALAEALEDPLSLLADRSPGGRPDGALFATKPDNKVVQDAVDSVLPLAREGAPSAADAPAPDANIADVGPDPLAPVQVEPIPAAAPPEVAIAGLPGGPFIGVGTPGFIIPIGGGPGSPGATPPGSDPGCCTSTTPGDPETPVVPAVPEPSTWALLMLGFFMVGATLRAKAGRTAALATT